MLVDGLQRLHMELRMCSPQSIHERFVPPGLRLLTAAKMDMERPGQCRPSLGSTRPGRLSLSDNAGAGIDARARARR